MENTEKIKLYNENRYKKQYPKVDIKNIIKSRLSMQSTARLFERTFNIDSGSVFAPATMAKYKTWDSEKQNLFIEIIGGIYKYQTKELINNLIYAEK